MMMFEYSGALSHHSRRCRSGCSAFWVRIIFTWCPILQNKNDGSESELAGRLFQERTESTSSQEASFNPHETAIQS